MATAAVEELEPAAPGVDPAEVVEAAKEQAPVAEVRAVEGELAAVAPEVEDQAVVVEVLVVAVELAGPVAEEAEELE